MEDKPTLREKVLIKSAQLLEIGFEPFEILAILSALEDKKSTHNEPFPSEIPFWPPIYSKADGSFTNKDCQNKESIPCLMMKADNGFDCFIPAVRDHIKNIFTNLYKDEVMKKIVLSLEPSGDVITAISVDNISLYEYMKEHPKAKGNNQIAVWITRRGEEASDKERAIIDYLEIRYCTSGDAREQEPHLVVYTEFATGDKVSLLLNHDTVVRMLTREGLA